MIGNQLTTGTYINGNIADNIKEAALQLIIVFIIGEIVVNDFQGVAVGVHYPDQYIFSCNASYYIYTAGLIQIAVFCRKYDIYIGSIDCPYLYIAALDNKIGQKGSAAGVIGVIDRAVVAIDDIIGKAGKLRYSLQIINIDGTLADQFIGDRLNPAHIDGKQAL